ncbi:polysaccharide deacetylase family protein [Eisenibacter elegans]|uniref:polysaccharide deacetylase family protein n=1 Tax=Eisenibacter elegans TaxID=997 RepID=UPI00041DCFAF|nr:polysaccharide deacetylase family protein [Eisenibacter elegans]
MSKKNKILLTFDLEEFDLPIEYGNQIDEKEMFKVTSDGLENLLKILSEYKIRATFFTTANYAEKHPKIIERIVSENNELASHMYYHSDYDESHILKSKKKLEEISNTSINGIRMPRLKRVNLDKIKEAGYLYDSSLNPTFIPGRYNNLRKQRVLFTDPNTDLKVLPFSTSIFRIPLFWLSFKNFNLQLYILLCNYALKRDSYLHLYFHPWEFANLSKYKIPFYIKRNSGHIMSTRFKYLLNKLSPTNEYLTITEFLTK